MSTSIEVKPVTPKIGAEIHGVNLAGNLSGEDLEVIKGALLEHQVIFFRDQDMTIDQQKDFGRHFGELHLHPARFRNGLEGHPEILLVHADEKTSRAAGDGWHSDVSCDEEPPMGSILRLVTVPETGGDTLFASMYSAYEALSEPMKTLLDGLTATHDGGPNYIDRAKRTGKYDPAKVYPKNSHPIVRTHPETGRKSLFINPIFTTHIDGIPKDESAALLGFLFDHIAKPAFQCRFRWQKNSIAFWDNRCAHHHAMWDYFPNVRTGHRVTIVGDKPV
jgi:taurine dioxygenase